MKWFEYSLIIHTDQYSGNFGRELAGFCIGKDDGYGDPTNLEAIHPEAVEWFDDYVRFEYDAYGVSPVQIRANEQGQPYDLAFLFYEEPPSWIIEFIMKRAQEFSNLPKENDRHARPKIYGWSLERDTITTEIIGSTIFRRRVPKEV